MRRSLLLLALLALALLLPHSAHAIVNGSPDDEHRYVGAFVATVTDPATGSDLTVTTCTGTLIAPDVVLSAAHCFVGLDQLGFRDVRFTLAEVVDEDLDGVVDAGVTLLSGEPRPHERFGTPGASNTYDIAVFLLDAPVTGVTPASTAPVGFLDDAAVQDDTFVAVGYGIARTSHRQAHQAFDLSGRRLQATQHLHSVTSAWARFSMNAARGDGGTCFGDSGGPHLHGDLVVSLTVTGDMHCKAVDTTYRVDTPWAQEFLTPFLATP